MRRLFLLLSCCLCLWALTSARVDVIVTDDGAKYRGKIVKETSRAVTIQTKVGKVKIGRDRITQIIRTEELREEFAAKFKRIKSDADRAYKVGKWAKREGLRKEARQAWERAVELDGYHEEARRALKHRKHEGRWYTRDDYRTKVLGLIRYQGKWIKPEDKGKIDQGFVRTKEGKWILAEGRKEPRPRRARPKPRSTPGGGATTGRKS